MEGRPGSRSVTRRAAGALLSRLLLDTTFLIDAERSGDALDEWIDDDDDAAIAAVTVAELRVGVLLATDRHRPGRAAFLEDVLSVLPVVGYDRVVAEAHAELLVYVKQSGTPRGAHDLLIAATARATARTVVTADRFAYTHLPGVEVRNHRTSTS